MEKNNRIIVIGRQYGGSGRKIGKILADKLGMAYYDKELINHISAHYGYDPKILMHADEKKPSAFRSMLLGKYGVMDMYASSPMSREALYSAQADIIRRVAQEGDCIIVGRTADYILRDQKGLVSVFLHAPIQWRASNVMERGEASTLEAALSKAVKADDEREGYYNYFTGRSWGKADNYHLSLDASRLTAENAANVIAEFAKQTFSALAAE